MRRPLLMQALAGVLGALAGCDSSTTGTTGPTPTPPTPASRGTSMGSPTVMMIGPAGGTLASGDHLFALTVPPGALAADTLLGVEPITSTAPGGQGQAYRL